MFVPAPAGGLTENETHMGRFPKALVMTLLIMEITAIVALTAVWTSLSELHASQVIINIALGLSVAGLCVLAVMAFRRALAAEIRLETEPDVPFMDAAEPLRTALGDLPGPNAVGPATGPAVSGDLLLVRTQPGIQRVV